LQLQILSKQRLPETGRLGGRRGLGLAGTPPDVATRTKRTTSTTPTTPTTPTT
jgi:hypothetical protein